MQLKKVGNNILHDQFEKFAKILPCVGALVLRVQRSKLHAMLLHPRSRSYSTLSVIIFRRWKLVTLKLFDGL